MSRAKIHYAVLALTKSKVDEVIFLSEKKTDNDTVITWLKKNKSEVYGDLPEQWKPFKGSEIREIIEGNSQNYHSETHLIIESIFEDYPCELDLLNVDIFFIDLFSMYLEEYKAFALRSDYAFCSAQNTKCCFLIDCRLPYDVQQKLEEKYNEFWPLVSRKYRDGFLHRVASRIDDLTNFLNYLITITESQDLPSSKAKNIVSKTIFNSYPNRPNPKFTRED